MIDSSFGEILANRRKQLGITIDQAVAATKLRPQVLRAFEASDFDQMPPKGYAQGMISSYARYLQLEPREILELYHSELYDYERKKEFTSRSRDASMFYSSPNDIARRREGVGRRDGISSRRRSDRSEFDDTMPQYSTYNSERSYRSNDRSLGNVHVRDRRDYYSQSSQQRYPQNDYNAPYYDDYPFEPQRRMRTNRREPKRTNRNVGETTLERMLGGTKRTKIVFVLSIIILVLLIILVAVAVSNCVRSNSEESVDENAPVVQADKSITDTNEQADTEKPTTDVTLDNENNTAAEPEPEPVGPTELGFTVEEGKSSWVEVSNGGKNVFAEQVPGGTTQTFSIDGETSITVSNPDAVTVTVDGKEVELEEKSGIGMFSVQAEDSADESNADEDTSASDEA